MVDGESKEGIDGGVMTDKLRAAALAEQTVKESLTVAKQKPVPEFELIEKLEWVMMSDAEKVLRDFYAKAAAAGVAAITEAVAKERERCARIIEQYTGAWDDEGFALAAKIRKGE